MCTSGPLLRAMSCLSVCPSFLVSTDLQGILTECKAVSFLLPQFPPVHFRESPTISPDIARIQ